MARYLKNTKTGVIMAYNPHAAELSHVRLAYPHELPKHVVNRDQQIFGDPVTEPLPEPQKVSGLEGLEKTHLIPNDFQSSEEVAGWMKMWTDQDCANMVREMVGANVLNPRSKLVDIVCRVNGLAIPDDALLVADEAIEGDDADAKDDDDEDEAEPWPPEDVDAYVKSLGKGEATIMLRQRYGEEVKPRTPVATLRRTLAARIREEA